MPLAKPKSSKAFEGRTKLDPTPDKPDAIMENPRSSQFRRSSTASCNFGSKRLK
jgi:hypothetical protein